MGFQFYPLASFDKFLLQHLDARKALPGYTHTAPFLPRCSDTSILIPPSYICVLRTSHVYYMCVLRTCQHVLKIFFADCEYSVIRCRPLRQISDRSLSYLLQLVPDFDIHIRIRGYTVLFRQ